MVTFAELLVAYKACRIGKRPSLAQVKFELRLGENLLRLESEIANRTYTPSAYRCFIVTKPKPREIFAANFRDRVIHHVIVSRLEPIWERAFHGGSYACRRGRGTHGALKQFQKIYEKVSQGRQKPVWVLQLDIASFFVSIQRSILKKLLLQKASDDNLRFLVTQLMDHDPRDGAFFGSPQYLYNLIPPTKSFFDQSRETGLPIGNLTSQFGANVYLNGLDHFVAREMRPKGYIRYMDDLTLVDTDPEKLQAMIEPIDNWLKSMRGQTLNSSKTVLSNINKESIELLGYRLTAKKSSKVNLYVRKIKKWEFMRDLHHYETAIMKVPMLAHPLSFSEREKELESVLGGLNSKLGLMRHAQSYKMRSEALAKFCDEVNFTREFLGLRHIILTKDASSMTYQRPRF